MKGVRVQEEESEASGELQTPIKSLYYLVFAGHHQLCSMSSVLQVLLSALYTTAGDAEEHRQ